MDGLSMESRHDIIIKIMETIERHVPVSSQEGYVQLKKIAVIFEETIYSTASSQLDYLEKIARKLRAMETESIVAGVRGKEIPDQGATTAASDKRRQGKSKKRARENAPIASNGKENESSEPAIVNGDACRSLAASIQALSNQMNANFAMLHGSMARLQKDVDSLRALLPGRGDDSM